MDVWSLVNLTDKEHFRLSVAPPVDDYPVVADPKPVVRRVAQALEIVVGTVLVSSVLTRA
jgi:hypothetical protein